MEVAKKVTKRIWEMRKISSGISLGGIMNLVESLMSDSHKWVEVRSKQGLTAVGIQNK